LHYCQHKNSKTTLGTNLTCGTLALCHFKMCILYLQAIPSNILSENLTIFHLKKTHIWGSAFLSTLKLQNYIRYKHDMWYTCSVPLQDVHTLFSGYSIKYFGWTLTFFIKKTHFGEVHFCQRLNSKSTRATNQIFLHFLSSISRCAYSIFNLLHLMFWIKNYFWIKTQTFWELHFCQRLNSKSTFGSNLKLVHLLCSISRCAYSIFILVHQIFWGNIPLFEKKTFWELHYCQRLNSKNLI